MLLEKLDTYISLLILKISPTKFLKESIEIANTNVVLWVLIIFSSD
jgi:hypothetical protein